MVRTNIHCSVLEQDGRIQEEDPKGLSLPFGGNNAHRSPILDPSLESL
jgi:hypothetical protein